MGFVRDRITRLSAGATVDWTVGLLQPSNTPNGALNHLFDPDRDYVNGFVRSARIVHKRRGRYRISGLVNTHAELLYEGKQAEFTTALAPSQFKGVSNRRVDRVVNVNHRAVGPIPYRGQDIKFEAGLFAVRSTDLTEPYMQVLEEISAATPLGNATGAMSFLKPLQHGFDLLTGSGYDLELEIGLAETMDAPQTGWWVVARAPRGTLNINDLRVASDNLLTDANDVPLREVPYIVVELFATTTRRDWATIPELGRRYRYLADEVSGLARPDVVKEAMTNWSSALRLSPDLHFADATAIVARAEAQIQAVMSGATAGSSLPGLPLAEDL